ncbi:MAG: DUF2520 domain-containing protein [Gemmatimonadaceae bacterium]
MTLPRVFIVGAGRAGRALAHAMRVAGVDVVGLHGRREGADITWGTWPASLETASVVLVTVRDAELEGVLRELVGASLGSDVVMMHASGSVEPAALDLLREHGHPCGTFHPLLPLTDPTRATEQLRRAWIGIDGDEGARAASRELAAAIGAQVLEIPAGEKARYHAAAVFVSNFPVVLMSVGMRLLELVGIQDTSARSALGILLMAAAQNAAALPPAQALTGPVARGDVETVRAHLAALGETPEILELYRALSREALPIAAEAGLDAARVEGLRRVLDEP